MERLSVDRAGISQCHLLADIGGTNARFALVTDDSAQLRCVTRFSCADFDSLEEAITAYLQGFRGKFDVILLSACLAVAAPVDRDFIQLTNNAWRFSRTELSRALGVPAYILNDFSAQALCLSQLHSDEVAWWQHPNSFGGLTATVGGPRTVVGPGTGFGASTLMMDGKVMESEPGHVSFAPVNEHETQLLQRLWQRYDRVSLEHLLSGPGLVNLYWANGTLRSPAQAADNPSDPGEIVARAVAGEALGLQCLHDFSAIMGSVCGDIALLMGSVGGIYLSGDMLGKLGDLFDRELFLARFRAKGVFQDWCRELPVGRLTLASPGLTGCAIFARQHSGAGNGNSRQ